MRSTVMACMRNEAPFLLEWAAYHLAIGFDDLIVLTNDCTDGTGNLLDRLQTLAPVHHVRNDDLGGEAPQKMGVLRALAHPVVADSDWLLHIDADEFLNIGHGDGLLRDLLPVVDDFDAVAICWRLFGDNGLDDIMDGLVIEQQTKAAAGMGDFVAMQKTMFRPRAFDAGIDHMPKRPRSPDVRLCNARGGELNPKAMFDPQSSDHRVAFGEAINRKRHIGWGGAVINHYAVKTRDIFLMKNVRGDGIHSIHTKRYFLHSRWHRAANRNDVEETSILRHLPAVKSLLAEWRADPVLAEIETNAIDRFRGLSRRYLTPENIAAWTNWAALEDAAEGG